jgi:signal peptidase I
VRQESAFEALLASVRSMLEIVVVAVFLLTFVVQPFRIPSESMEPTLMVGDFLLVNKAAFAHKGALGWMLPPARVNRGDLVVFHYPVDPSRDLVKRVIGVPGDRVRLRGGRVLIDEVPLAEPYAFYSPSRPNGFRDEFPNLSETDPNVNAQWWMELRRLMADGEILVPPGQYFVLGDNRNDSEDSRYWGFVPQAAIVGRPLVVYFSTARPAETPDSKHSAGMRLAAGFRAMRVLR